MVNTWESLAAGAQAHRDETVARIEPSVPDVPADLPRNVTDLPRTLLSPDEIRLTETPADQLLAGLASGSLSAVSVTKAFLRRAGLAQKLTNCILELVPEEALARASELDAYYAVKKQTVGPLHGLPISVKGRFSWKGLKASEGIVANLADVCPDDANVLKLLRRLGAVPFARTTEPQGLMMLENLSNIHGSTANPHNTLLTPGGSSGGESALLALLGSPLGLGSDVGGSVRLPAANCGIYTLKPTVGRLPMTGLKSFSSGCEMVPATCGPMTATREGVSIFMKAVLDTEPWKVDPTLHQIPWRDVRDTIGPTINVGVMWDDGYVKPSKAMTRALQEVVSKLEANPRFKVTKWEPYGTVECLNIATRLYAPDAGEAFLGALAQSGEPALDLASWRLITGPNIEKLSMQDYWKWTKARDMFKYNYWQEWINKAPDMHVILCPPFPGAAPPIGTSKYWGYTSIWNILDYPGAVFPVTKVDPSLDKEDAVYTPRNETDAFMHSHFDAEQQAGAPVSLQLVGKRFDDEIVVQAMNEICESVGLPFVDTVYKKKKIVH